MLIKNLQNLCWYVLYFKAVDKVILNMNCILRINYWKFKMQTTYVIIKCDISCEP